MICPTCGSMGMKCSLHEAAPDLLRAAMVFAFRIPTELADDEQVGVISNIPVYAGEIRRLNAAIEKAESLERWHQEVAQRDFERVIYEQCEKEDAELSENLRKSGENLTS